MTPLMCSVFYVYSVLAIQIYRNEIKLRADDNYIIHFKHKCKAPLPIRGTVLLCLSLVAINYGLYLIFGDALILVNAIPVTALMVIMRNYRKKINKLDMSNKKEV